MAHLREYFPVVADFASDEGLALHAIQSGVAPSTRNGIIGFSFKDASGNVVLPQLNSEGKIPVTMEGAGVPKSANDLVAGSLTETLVCEVALATSKTYGRIKASGSCFRETIYRLIALDDVTENDLGMFIVGPGEFSFDLSLGETEFASGASGTQKLQLKAINLQKVSDIIGQISCLEFAA